MLCRHLAGLYLDHPSGTGISATGAAIVTIPGTTLQKGSSALDLILFRTHFRSNELSDAVLEAVAAQKQHAHSLATLASPALGYSLRRDRSG